MGNVLPGALSEQSGVEYVAAAICNLLSSTIPLCLTCAELQMPAKPCTYREPPAFRRKCGGLCAGDSLGSLYKHSASAEEETESAVFIYDLPKTYTLA